MKLDAGARIGFLVLLGIAFARSVGPGERVIDAGWHHLGNDRTPEWTEAPAEPEGTRLDLEFESRANSGEWVLWIGARSVGKPWHVELNGERVARLRVGDARAEHAYPVPAGRVKSGTNRLAIVPDDPADDITVGNLRLVDASLRESMQLVAVDLSVRDDRGAPLPARITILDGGGKPVELYYAERFETAVRTGIVYTSEGRARVELQPGEYRAYASRGTEWSLATADFAVGAGGSGTRTVALALRREVDTEGFVACDTHVHTLTHSGHGDSSVDERVITLAGEGVELAVATDHNHHTDYRPFQAAHGLEERFTAVVGNEVTTEVGHFNAFPLDPAGPVPDHRARDYPTLVAGMREKGARVVILNHPRWPDHARGPFGVAELDPFTGARANGMPCPFDATELVNSTAGEKDPMQLFTDWFALLNRGEKVAAVGSSDSHTVGDPVGQGRTYVKSSADHPARIDVEEACASIASGRSSISLGYFVDASVDGSAGLGDLAPVRQGRIELALRVASASWARPQRAVVFVNGIERAAADVETEPGEPTDRTLRWTIEWPHAHDAWVVCVVTGPPVGPWWPTADGYTLAATNPIWLDADRDGRYQSPRAFAEARVRDAGSAEDYRRALAGCDSAVAVHVLDIARTRYLDAARAELERTAEAAAQDERVRAWLETLPDAR